MSQQQPGWFPDPYGTGAQRYWDGVNWTPHTQNAAGQPTSGEPFSSTPEVPSFPTGSTYGAAPSASSGYPSTSQPGAGYPGPSQPFTIADPTYYVGQNSPAKKSRTGLAVAGGVAAALVAGTGVWLGLNALNGSTTEASSSPTPTSTSAAPTAPPVTADPTSASVPTAAALPATSTVPLPFGELVTGTVPAGGTFAASFEVIVEGVYVISPYAPDGAADLVMTLFSSDGTQIAQGDDQPVAGGIMGGGAYDPLLAVYLTAGTYNVHLTDLNSLAVDFDLTAHRSVTKGGLFADTFDMTLDAGYYWLGWIDVPEGGTLTVDASASTESDLAAMIMAPDGTYWENDDRSGEDQNPYLSASGLSAGRYVVLVSEYYWEAADLTITISTQ